MTNEIKTRIQLKYDNYASWNTSNAETQKKHTHGDLVLKAGEIGIAKLVSDTTIPLDEQKNAPVLFKVGDGTHAFKDLPWASALAADVYAWAKASEVKLVDKKLTFVGGKPDGKDLEVAFDYVTAAEVNTLLSDYWNKGDADGRYKKLQTAVADPTAAGEALAFIATIAQDADGVITATKKNVKLDDYALKTDIHDGQLLMEMGEGLEGTSATFTANDADNVNFTVSHAVPKGATAGKHDGITTDKFGHVIGVDIYTKDEIDGLVQGAKDADTDTVTKLEATDQYINVSLKDTAFNDDGLNEYTIQLNEQKLKDLIGAQTTAAMEFMGATDVVPTGLTVADKGHFYKVSTGFAITTQDKGAVTAKIGDSIVWDGAGWYLIPSGDDIEDTWRPVKVGNNTLETNETLEFVAGDHVDISEAGGKVTIAAEDSTYELKAEALADGAKLLLDGLGADVEDSYVNFKDDNVVNVAYSQVSNEEIITFSHADKNAVVYTATGAAQTKTAAFGETVSFNIDTVSVDKKGHATAAQGTVNITLPALPEAKTYDLSVQDAGDVYVGFGSTVGLTISHDHTPVYLQGNGAGEENEKGDIDITYDSSDSSGSLVETITFDINRVRTSKLYDDTYDAKEKTTTLIFNCGSANDVI